ncbi:MAG: MFS transporter [Deltaproteobacteria bacterium]
MTTSVDLRRAWRFIFLMGLVSLLGDMTYEGGRSISGPYLAMLGAGAVAVGFFSGLADFLGYFIRLFSGLLSDRTRAYWSLTFLGYGLILAVPFLAFSHAWPWAVLCLSLERIGKAIRSPARDAILSHVTQHTGHGKGFAFHEAMDQIGAIAGPLLLGFSFYRTGGFRTGLLFLFLPALALLAVLAFAKKEAGRIEGGREGALRPSWETVRRLRGPYWFYGLFTFFAVAGFAPFPMIAFHLKAGAIVGDAAIPFFFAGAMAVDGVAALVVGRIYDRAGMRTLALIPLLTAAVPFFVFRPSVGPVLWGVGIWGVVLGIHETVMRAALADMTPLGIRGSAYGVFNTLYGLGALLSGLTVGFLYQARPFFIGIFVIVCEFVAALCLLRLLRKSASPAA